MHHRIDAIEPGFEEAAVGLEFERGWHDAGGIRDHAIFGNDGVPFDTGLMSVVLFHIAKTSERTRSCHPGKLILSRFRTYWHLWVVR